MRTPSRLGLSFAIISAAAIATGCGRTIDLVDNTPSLVEVTAGNGQSATVGLPLPIAPTITVRNASGTALTNITLAVAVSAGGGSVTGAPTVTSASGATPLGVWTLGTTPGINILTVIVGGTMTKSVVATGIAGPATKLTVKSGATGITGTVGFPVNTNIVLQVTDQANNPIQGTTVSLSASDGGSAGFVAALTDANGNVVINRWILGTVAGTQTLTVSVNGVTPVTITSTAVAGQALAVAPNMSLPIRKLYNEPSAPLSVRVTDAYGNPVAGTTVRFSARDGGGTISGTGSAVTNASGIATGGTWSLGPTFTQQTALASIVGAAFVFTGQVTSDNTASVRYVGTVDAALQTRVEATVNRLRMAVVGHLDDVVAAGVDPALACGMAIGAPVITETIHDILFLVQVSAIDGAGGTTIRSTPCLTRATLTGAISAITIDVADAQTMIDNGTFDNAVLHEMLHGLGFGTAWTGTLLLNPSTADPRFVGSGAVAAYAAAIGAASTGVAVENVGGAGIINVHWRTTTFIDELMTGSSLVGQLRPLSAVTLQSLADLGYTINPFAAQPFTIIGSGTIRNP